MLKLPAQSLKALVQAWENDPDVEPVRRDPCFCIIQMDRRSWVMTDEPINLDGHRSLTDQRETEIRRRPANSQPPSTLLSQLGIRGLKDQLQAGPAPTWVEVLKKWRFLLVCYASTPEAQDEGLQKLINQALGDMERLRKREERK